jgi:hypothetical protein
MLVDTRLRICGHMARAQGFTRNLSLIRFRAKRFTAVARTVEPDPDVAHSVESDYALWPAARNHNLHCSPMSGTKTNTMAHCSESGPRWGP